MCALLWPLLEKHAAPQVELAGEAQLAGVAAGKRFLGRRKTLGATGN